MLGKRQNLYQQNANTMSKNVNLPVKHPGQQLHKKLRSKPCICQRNVV